MLFLVRVVFQTNTTHKIACEDTNFLRDYTPFVLFFSQFLQIFTTFTLAMIVDIHTHKTLAQAQTIDTEGIHPWHATACDISVVERRAAEVDAIGEIGLDYACDAPRDVQMAVFRAQLSIAERHEKPVVLHCVRAFEEVMRVLRGYRLPAVIFHGFIGSVQQAGRAVAGGYYLSFGVGAFRSPKTIEALRSMPLDRLFAETDESTATIESIYQRIAHERRISTEELQEKIEVNYNKIFLQHDDR